MSGRSQKSASMAAAAYRHQNAIRHLATDIVNCGEYSEEGLEILGIGADFLMSALQQIVDEAAEFCEKSVGPAPCTLLKGHDGECIEF